MDLFDSLGVIILNQRSKSDRSGEFTFVGTQGSSVIDFAAVSFSCLHSVNDFKVLSHPGSDHLPIVVSLNLPSSTEREEPCTLPLLPKIKWTNNDNRFFL